MGRLGRFDTDSDALQRRIAAHERFGKGDLNAWIFEQLGLRPGMRVLDLGCGTGKQTLPAARAVGEAGAVVGIDASALSLERLVAAARADGVAERIRTREGRFDALGELLAGEAPFDRAVASYSLYYAEHAERVAAAVAAALAPGGELFFCGPSPGNNAELKRFHHDLLGTEPERVEAATFMSETGPAACAAVFTEVRRSEFENPLAFDSADALYDYWRSYNLYDPELDEAFRAAAARHFDAHEHFVTVKRVLGIRAAR